jgi:hypothetical protein
MGDGALPNGTMITDSNARIAKPFPSGGESFSNPARAKAATAVAGTIRQLKSFHNGRPVVAGMNIASLAAANPAAARMYPVDSAMATPWESYSRQGEPADAEQPQGQRLP